MSNNTTSVEKLLEGFRNKELDKTASVQVDGNEDILKLAKLIALEVIDTLEKTGRLQGAPTPEDEIGMHGKKSASQSRNNPVLSAMIKNIIAPVTVEKK